MKLTEQTLNVLRNFAGIHPNMYFLKGTEQKTVAEARNIFCTATTDVEFPRDFGIYDLNEFLSVLNLMEVPVLEFDDKYVTISDEKQPSARVTYFYTNPDNLTYPQKSIKMPPTEVNFTLKSEHITNLKSAAAALNVDELMISSSDGQIKLMVTDTDNLTSNNYSIDIDGEYPEGSTFQFKIDIKNLRKLWPANYKVSISSKLVSEFEAEGDLEMVYFLALEKDSKYEE